MSIKYWPTACLTLILTISIKPQQQLSFPQLQAVHRYQTSQLFNPIDKNKNPFVQSR